MRPVDWDAKYAARELLWSEGPNRFLPPEAEELPPGRALDLACGEGRNANWLAERGWTVTAVDFSPVALGRGRAKAEQRGVAARVEYVEADLLAYEPAPHAYDLVLVFYLQLPQHEREAVWAKAAAALAPGGTLVVVGHHARNLAEGTGGPSSPAVLYAHDEVAEALGPRGAGLHVERAEAVLRPVEGDDGVTRQAVDALVRARRP